tara:strand:+ start:145 stop:876 length:732 start_codon:yes stop_codon:yes gene_type:complete
VLNKIKKLFMKKENLEVEINPPEAPELNLQEQSDLIEDELVQIQPTAEELAEIKNQGYLEDSVGVVGYGTREEQYAAYAEIIGAIPEKSSILDFGCGRGDFFAWHETTYGPGNVDYLGIDANQTLIDTGKKIYNDINLICDDWNNIKDDQKKDWCINIRSNNLRYDLQTEVSDFDYVTQTIDKMFDMCNNGLIISLSSDKFDVDNQISYSPGDIANWAFSKYDYVAVDHTTDTNQFLVIIYKN